MTAPQTGTYHLDGLLEGPLGGDPSTAPRLADWVRIAHTSGYGFSLDTEGDSFNLLADNAPRKAPAPDADMAEPLRDLLEQLVGSFPPPLQPQLFSTVRSVQYGEGVETQTIFQVMPDGRVEAQQRTVDARTSKADVPLTTKDKVKLVGISLLVLLAIFGITSIFVDWGDHVSKAWRKVAPVDADAIETQPGAFEPYFAVKGIEAKASTLHITLERTDAFPTSVAAAAALHGAEGIDFETRQAVRALASGYVRVESFDAKGAYLGSAQVRVAELRDEPTLVLKLGIAREKPPATLRFTW